MELTLWPARPVADRFTGSDPAYNDVIDELRASCARRAPAGALLDVAGAVGVLRGSAPVVWVHGAADPGYLAAVLAAEAEVREVYVEAERDSIVTALRLSGWTLTESMTQFVRSTAPVLTPAPVLPIDPLTADDLADVRELLARDGGVELARVAASYGNDFFTQAAPVWMFGARDADGRLVGVVGVRHQGRGAMGFGLVVASQWRGTGLAAALISAAVGQARDAGAEFVHAQAAGHGGTRLRSAGFTAAGTWLRLTR